METVTSESGQISLKWSDHRMNFTQYVQNLHQSKSMADVTFVCEGKSKSVKAHKLILMAASEHFRDIFQACDLRNHLTVFLDQEKIDTVNYLLSYMYHGEIMVPQANYQQVLTLGRLLEVKGLESFIATNESPEQAKRSLTTLVVGANIPKCANNDS